MQAFLQLCASQKLNVAPLVSHRFAIDKAGKTLATVSLGHRTGDRIYATGPHLGGVFLIPAADTERFRASSRDLAARS